MTAEELRKKYIGKTGKLCVHNGTEVIKFQVKCVDARTVWDREDVLLVPLKDDDGKIWRSGYAIEWDAVKE